MKRFFVIVPGTMPIVLRCDKMVSFERYVSFYDSDDRKIAEFQVKRIAGWAEIQATVEPKPTVEQPRMPLNEGTG